MNKIVESFILKPKILKIDTRQRVRSVPKAYTTTEIPLEVKK